MEAPFFSTMLHSLVHHFLFRIFHKSRDGIAGGHSPNALLLGCVTGENPSETGEPVIETRALLRAVTAGHWVSVGGLLPFSNYSVRVRACNSQGCVESASSRVSLPPAGSCTTYFSFLHRLNHAAATERRSSRF